MSDTAGTTTLGAALQFPGARATLLQLPRVEAGTCRPWRGCGERQSLRRTSAASYFIDLDKGKGSGSGGTPNSQKPYRVFYN